MFGCGTGKKEKKREDGEMELPLTRPDLAIVCTQPLPTTPPPSSLTGPAGWLGPRLLAGFTNWLYNSIFNQPISSLAFFLFNSICFCNWPDWPGITN